MGISHVVVYIPLSMWIWIWGCVWLSAPFIRLTLWFVTSIGKRRYETMFPNGSYTNESVGCSSQPFLSKDNKPLHQYFSLGRPG